MYSKGIFIDFKQEEIDKKYLSRLFPLFESTDFLALNDASILPKIKDAEVIFSKISTKIDTQLIDAAPKLKYIGILSTAFNAIDAKYASSKGIAVCNLGGYSTEAVAEFFFAVLFELTRELERAKLQAQDQDYSFNKFMGIELKGKTLGVIGAGRIGSRVAEIGLSIGMKIIYFSRSTKPAIDKLGAVKMDLDDVLSKSDFVSLNLSLNKETEGIIDKSKTSLLKSGCVFIHLAQPKLIDQEAMMKKAASGDIIFVFDSPEDIDAELAKKLLDTKGCIVYPPIAPRTDEANTAKWETFVSNIEQFSRSKPQNKVN